MKVQTSVHGIRPAPRSLTPLRASSSAVLAPGGGELVLAADNSMLQFWDAARDCHVDRLQVCTAVPLHQFHVETGHVIQSELIQTKELHACPQLMGCALLFYKGKPANPLHFSMEARHW